jgi:sugar O-acyltransferase (sialic acid O-acetyltransferase NeuD family)
VTGTSPIAERPVLVFGAGPLALQALRQLRENGREVSAFVVDEVHLPPTPVLHGVAVVASSRLRTEFPPGEYDIFVAIGYRRMRARREVYERVRAAGYRSPNAVSRHALIEPDARLGSNNLIFAGCIVESGVALGSNNVLWSGVTLCHDSRMGDHNFLAPRTTIAGNCSIEDLCFFGAASTCVDGLDILYETYLRAGAVALSNTERLGKYAGNPARKIGSVDPQVGIRVGRAAAA